MLSNLDSTRKSFFRRRLKKMLAPERADKVLAHLVQYEYASLPHVLLEVLWHTGLRIGATRGLDVEDFNSEDQYLKIVHRPEDGTTLKKRQGRRTVGGAQRPRLWVVRRLAGGQLSRSR
jgi:integrase